MTLIGLCPECGWSKSGIGFIKFCDSSSHSVITLPMRDKWLTNPPLEIVIDTPNRPNILKNDGYDLTFRLYHPGEHNGFTEYTEETFSFYFKTKALLSITDFQYDDDSMSEGSISTISAVIGNDGTSIAINVQSSLTCDGVKVTESVKEHGLMAADSALYVEWEVESDHLDWWTQSTDVSCELSLTGIGWNGTALESKTEVRETTVSLGPRSNCIVHRITCSSRSIDRIVEAGWTK